MTSSGSPWTRTVFCLEVPPRDISHRDPVRSEMSSQTSAFALPSRGGADTRTTSLRLHSS